jgi:hypothetical protein
MNKFQFWALNFLSFVLAALLLGHYVLARHNDRLSQAVTRDRAAANSARQIEPVLDQLAKRIASGSETDPRLKNILSKYGLNVTLETDGKKKTYP